MAEIKRRKDKDGTRNGLLILAIGYVLSASILVLAYFAPILAGLVGLAGLASLIGALLVVLGRHSFGPKHSRNVILSVVLFIASIVITVIGTFTFTFSVLLATFNAASGSTSVTPASITNAFNILLITLVIGTVLSGLAALFLTYALQQTTGRILLLGGYISSMALMILNSIGTLQGLAEAMNEAFANGRYNPAPLQALQSQRNPIQLLAVLPTLAFALAFYLAWSRINRGELPESTTVPTTPAY